MKVLDYANYIVVEVPKLLFKLVLKHFLAFKFMHSGERILSALLKEGIREISAEAFAADKAASFVFNNLVVHSSFVFKMVVWVLALSHLSAQSRLYIYLFN